MIDIKRGIFILILIVFISGCSTPTAQVIKQPILIETTNSDLEVYFCPREDCEQHLFDFLNEAEVSIHCALFDLDLQKIIDLLEKKSKTVEVKIVTDGDNYRNIDNLSFVKQDNRSALMHNKFCIVDNKRIFTGSFNPTENCAYKNNNNMIIIESKYLAENYEQEFNELWNGVFGKGNRVEDPIIYLNNKRIENYFCPEDDCALQVQKQIQKANKSIYFLAFSFTHDAIATDLVLKHYEGVDVRGVFEKTRISQYSKYHLLEYQGMDVIKDNNKYTMHHKVFIIDNQTVITGSFNPSENADKRNDENVLVIEDEGIVQEYLEEFEYVWNIG